MTDQRESKASVANRIHQLTEVEECAKPASHRACLASELGFHARRAGNQTTRFRNADGTVALLSGHECGSEIPAQFRWQGVGVDLAPDCEEATTGTDD